MNVGTTFEVYIAREGHNFLLICRWCISSETVNTSRSEWKVILQYYIYTSIVHKHTDLMHMEKAYTLE